MLQNASIKVKTQKDIIQMWSILENKAHEAWMKSLKYN
jgi:hypothetical protein